MTSVDMQALAADVIARCRSLALFSERPPGIHRTFLSPPMRDVHRELRGWLESAGAEVSVDAAGNLRGLYPGEGAARLLIGSHLDTVPNAGAYDGVLGVVLAVELLQALGGRRLPFAIEVIGFSEEEGVRFGVPFIGSRALVGRLDDALLARTDQQGVSVRQAIRDFGLDPASLPAACADRQTFGYLEFHIEQGPVLEQLNLPLAVVEAIAGQSRWDFIFLGRANHAGTTPMNLRFDAITGAAEWIVAVEREAKVTAGLVATVGSVQTIPGATNVIAGEARVSLDVRHRDDVIRMRAVENLKREAERIAQSRGLKVKYDERMNQAAVAMDAGLCDDAVAALRFANCPEHRMASGAGHDAMILAEKVPAAMIFLPTPGGISHHPEESVAVDDVHKAILCGLQLLERLAAKFTSRTERA